MAIINASPIERAYTELNAVQLAALHTLRRVKLFATMMPRQVGKTHLGVWCLREIMEQDTNAQVAFFAKDYPSIQRSTQEKFLRLFPTDQFKVTSRGVRHQRPMQDAGRGMCFLVGLDKMPEKVRGGTMAGFHWSEVAFTQFQRGVDFRTVFQQVILPLISRTMGYGFLETTPRGSNFWKEFWESDSADPKSLSYGFTKALFPLELCIALGAITRDQVDFMRKTMHPDVFRQEMECLFVSFMGKLYAEYGEQHFKVAEPLPHERVTLGIDIGHTAGFSCLFGLQRDEGRYVFDQIYQKGLRIGQMVDLIEKRMEHWRIPRDQYTALTDHDPEMVAELQARHIKVELADKLDPFAARMSIKEDLYFNRLFVNRIRCPQLDKELNSAIWSAKKPDEMDDTGDPNEGHWDSEASLRYLHRGPKMIVEAPEEMPGAIAASEDSAREWMQTQKRREVRKEREKSGSDNSFEY